MVITVIDPLVIAPEDLTIEDKEVVYALSSSYVNPSTSTSLTWSATYPELISEGWWLHCRTTLVYSDGNRTVTYQSSRAGENGPAGYNTAPVFLYKRSATAITEIGFTDALTYNFSTKQLSATPNGWSQSIPANDGNPLYVTVATAYSNSGTDSISSSEWATPVVLAENGAHGLNTAPVFLYKRAASAPDKPSSQLTYTFASGVLSGTLSGWSQTIPATNGNPCWVIQATASGTGSTDTIAASEWSEQHKLVEDGAAGKDSIYATIDNNVGVVSCNSSGYTTSEQNVEANVCIEKGGVLQTIKSSGGIVCKIGGSYTLGSSYASADSPTPAQNYKVTISGLGTTSANVKVYVKSGTSINSPTKITITVKSTIDGVDVTRDVSLTIQGSIPGPDGGDQTSYEIRSTADSVTVAANDTFANLVVTLDFWKKVADNNPEAYECYYALYRRKGATYTRLSYNTTKVATKSYTDVSTTVDGVISDAFVVFIGKNAFSSNSLGSAAPTTYQAKKEIIINKLGDTGPGGEIYQILSALGSLTVDGNSNSATFTATVSFYKKVGSAAKQQYSCFCSVFRKKGSTYNYIANNGNSKAVSWYVEGLSINASTCDALVFCIFDAKTTTHSGYLVELEIPVYKHGDTGPTYWPSGNFDPDITYTKTGQRTPLVFMEDESMTVWNEFAQAYGEYWYLTADTNYDGTTRQKPQDGSAYWAKAENYGVIMVGAQFARFAKNGAGVMAGDYFYSANGRIDGVERVDGEGADGNTVSANNPPAYTRFMGDPTIQNGYFNRTNLQGPISGDKAVLATIYVVRGVTLTVRIKGSTYYDGSNTKYGYFYIYKGSTAVSSSYVRIYRLQRSVTLTFTAAETAEYNIVYYGSDASTKATFYANWELTGHFYPNWWVNLKEGKMHGAKDKFILDGDGDIKVDGAMMSHKVKLLTKASQYVRFPDHAAYEDDYWSSDGMVYLYEVESNGLPVRIYEGNSPAIYYGMRNCKLLYDQVYIGSVLGTGKNVWIYLPPPHLFIGQRITITNMATDIPSNPQNGGVFVVLDYMYYTRTDYSEGICLTGQEAYFEDDGTGEHDNDGVNGMPYIVGVPERGGEDPLHAAGIWTGETIQQGGDSIFCSNLENELDIGEYEWIELTSVQGPYWKYKNTNYWEETIKYNAYWMLTRWQKKPE